MSAAEAQVLELGVARLVKLDERVDMAEGDGLLARWEFGSELLAHRKGKQLPKGMLSELCEKTGKGRRELQYRLQFAERYPSEGEVRNVLRTFKSWNDVLASLKERTLAAVPERLPPLPDGTFRVVVADPPWQYSNRATRGAAEDHYKTMTIEQLCDLPVDVSAADNAHLYLWVTNGFIREAFDVVDAWGFEYKTCLTWVKPQMGLGNYFRSSTEHVLFGVRGNLRTQDKATMNWFEAPRTKHSAKPDCFYDMVEKCSPGPYLEMFARRRRLGEWETWGNEA